MTLAKIWWNEVFQEAYRIGFQQGLQQGIKLGEIQALSRTIQTQLTQKFGELPEELKQAISQANLDTLNQIAANIFIVTSLEEVKAYLSEEVS